jgi:hypothetical protein
LLIILGCYSTFRRYVMSFIEVWCCLLIILWCHFTLSVYVMSFIACDGVWNVILLSEGMWCLLLYVMLPVDHFWVSYYFQEVFNVFYYYWKWCCLLIILGSPFTFSRYVMFSNTCDTICWLFCVVILLLASMWYFSLDVELLTDYFMVLFYF